MVKLVFLVLCHEQEFASKIKTAFDAWISNPDKNIIECKIIREIDNLERMVKSIRNRIDGEETEIVVVANENESILSSNFKGEMNKINTKPVLICKERPVVADTKNHKLFGFEYTPFCVLKKNEGLYETWLRFFHERSEGYRQKVNSRQETHEKALGNAKKEKVEVEN